MRMKKRVVQILGAFVLVAAVLSGCGKQQSNGEGGSTKNSDSKNYVYSCEILPINQEAPALGQMIKVGDTIYGYGYNWSDDYANATLDFYEIKEDGSMGNTFSFEEPNGTSYSNICADDAGNLFCIKNVYGSSQGEGIAGDSTAEAEGETLEEDYYDDYYLAGLSLNGEETFSVKLNDVPELQELEQQEGYFSVYGMFAAKDSLYVSCMGKYVKFDKEGNCQGFLTSGSNEEEFDGAYMVTLQNGTVVAETYKDDGVYLSQVDLEAGTMQEGSKLPGSSYGYSLYPGIGYDLYLADGNGLYGYNLGQEDKTKLFDFVASDLGCYGLGNLLALSETQFLATYSDSEVDSVIAKFTKVPPEEVKDKQVITLAMAFSDWQVRTEVIKFNKNSDTYRIELQDYSTYATDEDYRAGLTKLNADLASGKVPDILLLDSGMPVESYQNKGLFEDLKPFIEKDEELELDNFMPNIIEAFSSGGKLYSIVPGYSIQTLAVKTADVGNATSWTVEEAQKVLASKPEGTQFLAETTRDQMLNYCINMAGSQFVDQESGKCSFSSDEFINLLEFVKTFPEKYDDQDFDEDYYNNYDSMWRQGKVLAYSAYLGDFGSFNRLKKGTFGEDITLIGFPANGENGSVIMPSIRFAMSSKSANKDAAWQFIRTFLMEDYQKDMGYLPISISQMEKMAQEATQKPYYMDENGNKVEYDDTWYIGDTEITISPMTEQETKDYMAFLQSCNKVYMEDEALLQIVQEEAAPFFAGQKSARDVAGIIQSRAQLYVNETR